MQNASNNFELIFIGKLKELSYTLVHTYNYEISNYLIFVINWEDNFRKVWKKKKCYPIWRPLFSIEGCSRSWNASDAFYFVSAMTACISSMVHCQRCTRCCCRRNNKIRRRRIAKLTILLHNHFISLLISVLTSHF